MTNQVLAENREQLVVVGCAPHSYESYRRYTALILLNYVHLGPFPLPLRN
jgi:hypothetical protein